MTVRRWFTVCFYSLIIISTCTYAGSIKIKWDENKEDDLLGYRVYWGFSPSKLVFSENVGNVNNFEITGIDNEKPYYVAVSAIDFSGNESELSTIVKSDGSIYTLPAEVELNYVFPNPFLPDMHDFVYFEFLLPDEAKVKISIYNQLGQLVNEIVSFGFEPGKHVLPWDGRNHLGEFVACGIYYCQLNVLDKRLTRQVTILR